MSNIALPPTRSIPTENKSSDTPSKTERWANTILDGVKPIQGTLAETYLTKVRGISKTSGKDLKFHPRVYVEKDDNGKPIYAPAMLSLVEIAKANHRAYRRPTLAKTATNLIRIFKSAAWENSLETMSRFRARRAVA